MNSEFRIRHFEFKALHGLILLALGVGVGVLVSFDRALSPYHPLWGILPSWLPHTVWWWTPTALLVLLLLLTAFRGFEWAFERRYALAAVPLLASTTLTGLNIANRDPFEIALLWAVTVWVTTTLAEHRPIRTPRFVLALLLGMSACVVASVVNGRVVSLLGLHTYLAKFMAAFVLIELIATPELHRTALRVLIVISVFSALVALGSEVLFVLTGFQLSLDDAPTARVKMTPIGPLLRATALLPTAQSLGHLLTVGLGLALCRPGALWMRLLLAALIWAGAAATLSTGSLVSTGVILAVWPFVQWPARTLHFLALLVVAGIVVYLSGVLDSAWDALKTIGSWGLNERVELIHGGLRLVSENPLCGCGVRNDLRVLHLPVHNSYLQIAAETGVAGGVLFTLLAAYSLFGCAAAALAARAAEDRAWLTGLALGMCGIAVHFLSEPLANDYLTYAFFGVAIGAATFYRRPAAARSGDRYAQLL